MSVFYQGEDVTILLEAYTDETLQQREDYTQYEVTGVLYTARRGRIIRLGEDKDIPFVHITDSTLQIDIPRSVTQDFKPGFMKLELQLIPKKTGSRRHRISVTETIEIKPSIIGHLK